MRRRLYGQKAATISARPMAPSHTLMRPTPMLSAITPPSISTRRQKNPLWGERRERDRGGRRDERAQVQRDRESDEIRGQEQPVFVAAAGMISRPDHQDAERERHGIHLRLGRVEPRGRHSARDEGRRERHVPVRGCALDEAGAQRRGERGRGRGKQVRRDSVREEKSAFAHTLTSSTKSGVPGGCGIPSEWAAAMNSPASQKVTSGASVSA